MEPVRYTVAMIACLMLLVTTAVAGADDSSGRDDDRHRIEPWQRCGTRNVFEDEAEAIQARIAALLPEHGATRQRNRYAPVQDFPPGGVVIPVAVHVIHNGTEGILSESDINIQMTVLNSAYQSAGVQFVLADVEYVENAEWFTMEIGTAAVTDCKTSLAYDTSRILNLYTASIGGGLLGFATFPWDLEKEPALDGVVILYSTFPGGAAAPYDEGDTVVHEVGHWLGLYHTFQPPGILRNGCLGRGDFVDDTPYERSPGSKCLEFRNTCLLRPGRDPIHNYMDYTEDACMYEFTPGQIERLQAMTVEFRPALLAPSTVTTTTTIPGGSTTTTVPGSTTTTVPGSTTTTVPGVTTTTTVPSSSQRPVITSFTVDPTYGDVYTTYFTFTCVATDPDGFVTGYVWDIDGDNYIDYETVGGTLEGIYYFLGGTYTVQVQAYDNDDNYSDIATVDVTVYE